MGRRSHKSYFCGHKEPHAAPEATELSSRRKTTNGKASKVHNRHRVSLFLVTHLVTINP